MKYEWRFRYLLETRVLWRFFAFPDTDLPPVRCQNRKGHSPLAIHTAAFGHVLVIRVTQPSQKEFLDWLGIIVKT